MAQTRKTPAPRLQKVEYQNTFTGKWTIVEVAASRVFEWINSTNRSWGCQNARIHIPGRVA